MRISDWSSDVCSSDLLIAVEPADLAGEVRALVGASAVMDEALLDAAIRGWSHNTRRAFRSDLILWGTWCRRRRMVPARAGPGDVAAWIDRKSTRLNSSQ